MAPPLVIGQGAQVKLYYAIGTELAVNVFGATIVGTISFGQALADTLGAAIKASFATHWAPQCPPTTQLARVGVRDLRTANQPEYRDVGPVSPGTGTGDPLPYSAALCVTLRTPSAGKSFRGRVYLPGASETANDTSGRIATTTSTAGVQFVLAVLSNLATNSLTGAVISRPAERYTIVKNTFHADGSMTTETISSVSAKPGGATPIISAEARTPEWESQRRRINRRSVAPVLSGPVYIGEVGAAPPQNGEETASASRRGR